MRAGQCCLNQRERYELNKERRAGLEIAKLLMQMIILSSHVLPVYERKPALLCGR